MTKKLLFLLVAIIIGASFFIGAGLVRAETASVQTSINLESGKYYFFKLPRIYTLDELGLYNSDGTGIAGGANISADLVLAPYYPATSPNVMYYKIFYYKTSGLGTTGWHSTESVMETNVTLPNEFIMIKRLSANTSPAVWTYPAGTVYYGEAISSTIPTDGSARWLNDFKLEYMPTDTKPLIFVDSPNGGEQFPIFSRQTIRWSTSGANLPAVVKIYYRMPKTGSTYQYIADAPKMIGAYNWTVPNVEQGQYVIRVTLGEADCESESIPGKCDESNAPFTVTAPPTQPYITEISPTNARAGEQIIVYGNNFSGSEMVVFSQGETSTRISAILSAPGKLISSVPNLVAGLWNVSVVAKGATEIESNKMPFTIASTAQPSITVLSPNGGESLEKGKTYSIRWTSSNVSAVAIRVMNMATGEEYRFAADGLSENVTASLCAYSWTVPQSIPAGSNYSVAIVDPGNISVADTSDSYFAITAVFTKPSITVLSPDGGENWKVGDKVAIRWVTSNVSENEPQGVSLKLSYRLINGVNYEDILVSESGVQLGTVNNSGMLEWVVHAKYGLGNVDPGSFKLLAMLNTSAGANVSQDYSDNYFTIISTTPANRPPVISGVTSPTVLSVNQTGTWTVKASDPENGSLSYSVAWGDESQKIIGQSSSAAPSFQQSATFTHVYSSAGTYTVNIMVKDDAGLTAQTSATVSVGTNNLTNKPPKIIDFSSIPSNIQPGQSVNFSLSATDPDNDDLWWGTDWGERVVEVTACSSARRQTGAGWKFNMNHAWAKEGIYNINITVNDCLGGSDSYSLSVKVGNPIQPSVTVLSPNGGESWQKGTTQTIRWQDNTPVPACSAGTTCLTKPPLYNIYLQGRSDCAYQATCAYTEQVIAALVNSNSFSWKINDATSGNYYSPGGYKIRVCKSNSDICDLSDAYFTITASIESSLSASLLLNSSADQAGLWGNFGPGVGNINKNSADWNWTATLKMSTEKTIARMTIIHNTRGEVWSTGYSRYLQGGTDLYGYEEHPYPLVIMSEKQNRLNSAYDQTLGAYGAGTIQTFSLYGQPESGQFTGGQLIVEFTDGTSVTAKIMAANNAPSTKIPVEELAKCLTANGLRVYTDTTCPYCLSLKNKFGEAWKYVTSLECSLASGSCASAGVAGIPTWVDASGSQLAGDVELSKIASFGHCPITGYTATQPIKERETIKEQVKCVFKDATTEQKCYTATDSASAYHDYGCEGTVSCVTDLSGAYGDKITWKSTCGQYAYTVMDGVNDYAIFNCADPNRATPATPTTPPTTVAAQSQAQQIIDINEKSRLLAYDNFGYILAELSQLRNTIKEQQTEIKYLKSLVADVKNLSENTQAALNNFITYGVDANTQKLGAGERAAVINSYKAAFSKLPETEAELADAIKIANGRFPSVTSVEAEKTAQAQFIKIYKRAPNSNNANDKAAIKVMAYGLRQKAENRNLNSEQAGIKIYKNIFGNVPKTTQDWNTMQAITYSGASR